MQRVVSLDLVVRENHTTCPACGTRGDSVCMKIPRTTYHCHTTHSDGQSTLPELVEVAAEKGMKAIGVSDHLVLHPTMATRSMDPDDLDAYVQQVLDYRDRSPIPLFLGIEIDYFPDSQHHNTLMQILDRHPFDYVIGSIHMLGEFSLDDNAMVWMALTQQQVDAYNREYWRTLERMLEECPWVDIIGHLDIPKKFGILPTEARTEWIERTLDGIQASGKAIELNTAGWDHPCAEGYPDRDLLSACRNRKIPLVVNDDAHSAAQLGRHYDHAERLLDELGYAPTWQPTNA